MTGEIREFPADPETVPFSEERRHRLVAAVLGASGQEIVTVRAADLRACLEKADAVDAARQIIGENATLKGDLAEAQAEALSVPLLKAQIAALEGRIAALQSRDGLIVKILTGKPLP